jgi:hypothetical protein
MAAFFDATSDHLPSLAPLDEAMIRSVDAKAKATVVLQFLRKAAAANRTSTGRPFYSIRTVAKHFALPTTTVTRMYDQLKTEGILGSIWGSKTIIEPPELDNDIHVRGMVVLPVPLRGFSATSTYRLFLRHMQLSLWRERFGSQVFFYDDSILDAAAVADALLELRPEGVIWLMPPHGISSCFARLRDRGVKFLTISDELPINGGPGYFLSWQDAVIQGLHRWKHVGFSRAIIFADAASNSGSPLRVLQFCLTKLRFTFDVRDESVLNHNQHLEDFVAPDSGAIFLTAKSVLRFSQSDVDRLHNVLRNSRVLFIHGMVDLPLHSELGHGFDFVAFDWVAISRRIVNDLVSRGYLDHVEHQTIFKAKWSHRINRPGVL